MKTKTPPTLMLAIACAGLACSASAALIWVEGESGVPKNAGRNAWYESVDPDELSGGKWFCSFNETGRPAASATYTIEISEAGAYRLWLRANPRSGNISYRLDDAAPVLIDLKALRDEEKQHARDRKFQKRILQQESISIDAKWDARFIAWINAGTLELATGAHSLAFTIVAEKDRQAYNAIDCFVLTTEPFTPNGTYKPGVTPAPVSDINQSNTWAFQPPPDAFASNAFFDLRGLNETFAGEHGFIRRSADGADFVRGDGQPIRFWGGSDYVQRMMGEGAKKKKPKKGEPVFDDPLAHHARFLAKRGVNIVRWHGHLPPAAEGSAITDINEVELDEALRLVAAMKHEGIYTILSPYWGSHTDLLKSWGVPDPQNDNCAALVFFDETVQKGYKAWLRRLYAETNSYTGIPLAKDPAVAIIQLQNEDSMLFYTMERVKGAQRQRLCKLFGDWATNKYGTLEKAKAAWGGDTHADDCFAEGRAGLYMVWLFTQNAIASGQVAPAGRARRLADQLEFMAETMRNFNAMIATYLREDLGCVQLINAGNWKSVDQVICDDAERWSYTANDVIGKNHYYGAQHKGFQIGWKISAGQYYCNSSAILRPQAFPSNIRQVAGYPFIIPESLWVPPLLYQAEAPLIVASQLALSGVDTFYWFATGVPEWQPPGNKWTYATPGQLGQFPAAALLFRQGWLKRGDVVVHEERSMQNIWERKQPLIAESPAWDPNRDSGDLPLNSGVKTTVNPLAFAVGPVEVKYGGDPAKSRVVDLAPYLDEKNKRVKSITGEIEIDYGRGVYRVNAPKAQGVAGFLKAAGRVELADLSVTCANAYGAVVVVPLDDQPISQSKKLLVQIGTVCRPTGWQARPAKFLADTQMIDGWRIIDEGKPPWRVENAAVTITVRNPHLRAATLLDVNGMPLEKLQVGLDGERITVSAPPAAMYIGLHEWQTPKKGN